MKVLYIGVFLDGTGWAQAATDYALALDAAGVDVVCRPIKLNDRQSEIPVRIKELIEKPSQGCNICIQHVLPHQMEYNGLFDLNIGVYESETSNFNSSVWANRLNCMDCLIVPNEQMVESAKNSGVNKPISVVPHATDIEKFQSSYGILKSLSKYKNDGDFIFYWMGEFIRRKNLAATIKAFHLEFDCNEPVQLLIKTGLPGKDEDEMYKHVDAFCKGIKEGLKIYGDSVSNYKKEIIITDRFTEVGIRRLHNTCNCFVMPSYGEAWSYPAFDAMGFGNTPIVTNSTGFKQYMNNDCGWLVDSRPEPVFGVKDVFSDLYTGREVWDSVDVLHLQACMREAYSNPILRQQKSINGIKRAYDFSYDVIGERLVDELERHRTEKSKTSNRKS